MPDVDMDTPLPDAGLDMVRDIMREVRPDTVLTFGPDGMTGHLAHKSVSRWATDSFDELAPLGGAAALRNDDPRLRGGVPGDLRTARDLPPGTPPVTAPGDLSIDLALDEEALDRKFRAISEHQSQIGYIVEAIGADVFRRQMANEWFRLAAEKA